MTVNLQSEADGKYYVEWRCCDNAPRPDGRIANNMTILLGDCVVANGRVDPVDVHVSIYEYTILIINS